MLLLPDNVRIRRFNMSSEEYSDYVENAEHIKALDYMWDPEGESLSKNTVAAKKVLVNMVIKNHVNLISLLSQVLCTGQSWVEGLSLAPLNAPI